MGQRSDCTSYPASGCVPIQWPGERTTARHELEPKGEIRNWFGGLVDDMRDAHRPGACLAAAHPIRTPLQCRIGLIGRDPPAILPHPPAARSSSAPTARRRVRSR